MPRARVALYRSVVCAALFGGCARLPSPASSAVEYSSEGGNRAKAGRYAMSDPIIPDAAMLALPNTPFVDLEPAGYVMTCVSAPSLAVERLGRWRRVAVPLPAGGGYTIDGIEVEMGGECDVLSCVPIDSFLRVPLVEYVEVGERRFESRPLRGRVRITFRYYADEECTSERVIEQIVVHQASPLRRCPRC